MPEIADLAGVKLNTIVMWRIRHRGGDAPFPEDDVNLCGRPVWRLERVTAWLDLTHRPYDVARWRTKRMAGAYRRPPTAAGRK
ncbi:hypothetical protein E1218_04925 [Kribbella turkmenica]|uniref:Uncharacterized protein n=1 Tax=Kribbella turkmenica TaxID=2530375 RepID=A0A4R4XEN6_9ACTN|nr:hypothetical protein [Kribbella turkmenica]TDD29213.1 hypothetical protein E1218_04925 [Kribbella turkmenica]